MTTPAWIGLGSNLGDRRAILDGALEALATTPGVTLSTVSSYLQTTPVGGPPGQGPFLNAAAQLETDLEPSQLLAVLQEVESRAGRVREVRWGERTLDLDLLLFGSRFLHTRELKLPHPRLPFRRFVLEPLAEIAPKAVDVVTGQSVADLLANLERRPRFIAIDGPAGRRRDIVFRRLVDELPAFGVAEADLKSPVVGEGDSDSPRILAKILEGKVRTLNARLWEVEALRVPWIVADFSLGLDIMRASSSGSLRRASGRDNLARAAGYGEGMVRSTASFAESPTPTFSLVLPDEIEMARIPGLRIPPRLRPDSDDPETIVAEVLATCRGIEG